MSHIRRCTLDFNVIMPAARRRRLLQMKKDTRQMLHADANGNTGAGSGTNSAAPVQQELPLKE